MWLTRLRLNPRSPVVVRALGDVQALHRLVMAGFRAVDGDGARAELGVLHRLDVTREGGLLLLIQSDDEPGDWASALAPGSLLQHDGVSVRSAAPLLAAIEAGAVFDFRLRANPTKRLQQDDPAGRLQKGARVGLRGPAQLAWLVRKGAQHGFSVDEVTVVDQEHQTERGRRRGSDRLVLEGVTFAGQLRVTDAAALRSALKSGIGSGKAYGFGLLSLARAGSQPS
jgi:CRISPR system Cascade subunit CasE